MKTINFNLPLSDIKEDTKLNILDDLICEELTKLGYKVDFRARSDAKGVSAKLKVEKTYGYETEKKRIQLGLENTPHINARIIANGKMKRSRHDTQVYYMKEI